MNSLNQKLKNKNRNKLYLILLVCLYSLFVVFNSQKLFQKFDPQIIERYLRSQDIEDRENKIKDRIIISDEEIYIASGHLYVNGAEPVDYNFQHPPFIKYLYGISVKYFDIPLLPNVFLGLILLFEAYFLGKLIFKDDLVGFLASTLLLIDPVFKEVTTYALLDLGQIVLLLAFIISTTVKGYTLQGILLGLLFASKFYSPIFIFLFLYYIHKLINKELDIKKEIKVITISLIVFYLTYFLKINPIEFIFLQAKIVKFMLDHNQASIVGGVTKMFFGGYYLWPILFFANIFVLLNEKFMSLKFFYCLVPIAYLLVMIFQIPFTRYFILLLPFLYLSAANIIINVPKNVHNT